jgi:2-keto-4-pentenoate hydratase/2-oxohepta-3-ene-1,7-dioic acid hydratase in catechol pathway
MIGEQLGDEITELADDNTGHGLVSMLDELRKGSRVSAVSQNRHRVGELEILAPVPNPRKIAAIGLNYEGHRLEANAEVAIEPTVFSKFASSITGPCDDIVLPSIAPRRVDYEAELAVVLAGGGRNILEADAMTHVLGYTIANDVSARDWQSKKPGGQWLLGKSFDTFLPLGPLVVTPEEIPDPHSLEISCTVSGELLQRASTSELIFKIPHLIAYLSQVSSIELGDLLLTGTPAGVGMARQPPRWLRDGDLVETTIEFIGSLQNRVRGPVVESLAVGIGSGAGA